MQVLAAATACSVPRRPFVLDGIEVGSVAEAHLPLLAAAPVDIQPTAVVWRGPADGRDAAFDRLHRGLREQGHIRAWRDETYAIVDPSTLRVLARIERAASRFWGTLTFGAHATGYVAGADGRPAQLWIAQRSLRKATDPGLHDNLVGGGVPFGQTPHEALVREAFEEAGLTPAQLLGAAAGPVLRLRRDVAEGLQHEWLYSYDVELPAGLTPQNQDGEVAGFTLLPPHAALALAQAGRMTVDAALVTIDFALRHGLLDDDFAAACVRKLNVPRRS